MFNGYEMWKPDAERCTRYRLTNAKGSACGRCMKTCPLNKVVTADGALMERMASWCGIHVRWLKPVLAGDTLRVIAEIVEISPAQTEKGRDAIRMSYRTINQKDEPVLTLTSLHFVKRRPT